MVSRFRSTFGGVPVFSDEEMIRRDASAVPGNLSEEDVQQIKAVLKHLKEVKATREKEKEEAEKAAVSGEKK